MMVPQAIRMADSAFKKYKTRDPYEIIDARRIKLKDFYTLNSLLAFYTISNRKQVIGLNGHADPVQRRTGAVHELGHSLNDYKLAASGCEFGDYSFFSLSSAPLEFNANLTGAELCIDDEFILDSIYYNAYKLKTDFISEHIDNFRTERARLQFEDEHIREFYDLHSDIPSYDQLAAELGVDPGMIKFKFKALRYKGYDLPNIPETRADFLRNWQHD